MTFICITCKVAQWSHRSPTVICCASNVGRAQVDSDHTIATGLRCWCAAILSIGSLTHYHTAKKSWGKWTIAFTLDLVMVKIKYMVQQGNKQGMLFSKTMLNITQNTQTRLLLPELYYRFVVRLIKKDHYLVLCKAVWSSAVVIVGKTAVWIDGTSQRFTCTNKHARPVRLRK